MSQCGSEHLPIRQPAFLNVRYGSGHCGKLKSPDGYLRIARTMPKRPNSSGRPGWLARLILDNSVRGAWWFRVSLFLPLFGRRGRDLKVSPHLLLPENFHLAILVPGDLAEGTSPANPFALVGRHTGPTISRQGFMIYPRRGVCLRPSTKA